MTSVTPAEVSRFRELGIPLVSSAAECTDQRMRAFAVMSDAARPEVIAECCRVLADLEDEWMERDPSERETRDKLVAWLRRDARVSASEQRWPRAVMHLVLGLEGRYFQDVHKVVDAVVTSARRFGDDQQLVDAQLRFVRVIARFAERDVWLPDSMAILSKVHPSSERAIAIDACSICSQLDGSIHLDYRSVPGTTRPPALDELVILGTTFDRSYFHDGDISASAFARCPTCNTLYELSRDKLETGEIFAPNCDKESIRRLTPHFALERMATRGSMYRDIDRHLREHAARVPGQVAANLALVERGQARGRVLLHAIDVLLDAWLIPLELERIERVLLEHPEVAVRAEAAARATTLALGSGAVPERSFELARKHRVQALVARGGVVRTLARLLDDPVRAISRDGVATDTYALAAEGLMRVSWPGFAVDDATYLRLADLLHEAAPHRDPAARALLAAVKRAPELADKLRPRLPDLAPLAENHAELVALFTVQ